MSGSSGNQLPSVGLLTELDPAIRQRLAACGRFETISGGDYLIRQGEPHDALSVVVSGNLVISCHRQGDYVELAKLGSGHTVGEMSLLDPQKSSADVRVDKLGACIWTINGDAFNALVESDKETGYAVMKMLAKEMCRRLRQNSDHMLHQADELRTHFLDIDY